MVKRVLCDCSLLLDRLLHVLFLPCCNSDDDGLSDEIKRDLDRDQYDDDSDHDSDDVVPWEGGLES